MKALRSFTAGAIASFVLGCAALSACSGSGQSSADSTASASVAGATPKIQVLSQPAQTGLYGNYTGNLVSADSFSGEINGTQPFILNIERASASPADARTVARIHLISDGDVFPQVDFTSALDVYLNAEPREDGSLHYEFLTPAQVIPGLTATKVRIQLELTLVNHGLQVDSSQSLIRILDCGFSGAAGCSRRYSFADFSDFGKR